MPFHSIELIAYYSLMSTDCLSDNISDRTELSGLVSFQFVLRLLIS